MRIGFDAIYPQNIPKTASIVGSYVSGEWPNFPELASLFPNALWLSIATNAQADAHCLDIERYDATPDEAPAWATRQRAQGNPYPWCYMNESTWPSVRQAFHAQGVPEPLYWTANYDNIPTVTPGSIGKQYNSFPGYDVSVFLDQIPGFDTSGVDDMTPEQNRMLIETHGWASEIRARLLTITPNPPMTHFYVDAAGLVHVCDKNHPGAKPLRLLNNADGNYILMQLERLIAGEKV